MKAFFTMIAQKALIIMGVVFLSVFIRFGFDTGYAKLSSIYGDLFEPTEETEAEVEFYGQTYLFPITEAQELVVDTPKSTAITTPISPYRLNIPSLNITAPIIFEPTTIENRIYSALERGIVHYAESPTPGFSGTSIIIGHSSSYPWYKGKYGSVFSKLSELKEGEIFSIEKDGEILNYQVTKSIIFSPKDNNDFELRELESTEGSSIVLITCWPTGTNAKRVAVRADLI